MKQVQQFKGFFCILQSHRRQFNALHPFFSVIGGQGGVISKKNQILEHQWSFSTAAIKVCGNLIIMEVSLSCITCSCCWFSGGRLFVPSLSHLSGVVLGLKGCE